MSETLDLTAITRALKTLEKALNEYQKDSSDEFVRDACIQRFEYCYDLSVKMIQRYLSMVAANPGDVKEMSFQSQIREAYTQGIVKNSWDKWWEYRDNRNKTSHSYNEAVALEVMSGLDVFYHEVNFLLQQLVTKNEN